MSKELSDIGLIGLAVMGQNLALNIADHGFRISVYNRTTSKTGEFVNKHPGTPGGLHAALTLEDFVASIQRPRKIIILVQAGKATDAVIDSLVPLLEKNDIIIDGGNSLWSDTIRREKDLATKNLRFIGSGVSGGEEGARFGPSLMPGGAESSWNELAPIWNAIAAKVDATTGKPLEGAAPGKPVEGGVPCTTYIGPNGAGHFVKMVHNGIEYGMMAAIAEGLSIIKHADAGKHQQEIDAETTPLRDPEYYQYEIDVAEVAEVWRRGSVVGSWLVDLTASALAKDPGLEAFDGHVSDSGEGRWTTIAAIEEGVPAPVITAALIERFESRGLGQYSGKAQSAMRSEFGGHSEKKA